MNPRLAAISLVLGLFGCGSGDSRPRPTDQNPTEDSASEAEPAAGPGDTPADSALPADAPADSAVPADAPADSAVPAAPSGDSVEPVVTPEPAEPPLDVGEVVWDDFDYSSWKDPAAADFGWRFRTGTGWPGQQGVWSPDQIVFLTDADEGSIMRLESYTDGVAGPSTVQTQASRQPPDVFHGTYAARIRLRQAASVGPDTPSDQLTQTFYGIVGIEGDYADPGYPLTSYEPYDRSPHSELDFEYLPHGGWGHPAHSMTVTTWAPSYASHADTGEHYEGWHVGSIQFDGHHVVYAIDGVVFHEETGAMPQTIMSMNFNQWFLQIGSPGERREYWEDVDWVFYADGEYLTNDQILERVEALRSAGVPRLDNR